MLVLPQKGALPRCVTLRSYVASETSSLFPQFPIADWVEQAINRAWTMGSLQALEELEASVMKQ
jgi:hypothetical protein